MNESSTLSTQLQTNIHYLEQALPLSNSFDIITRNLHLGNTPAFFVGINGFCRTDILQQILSNLQDPYYMQNLTVDDIAMYVSSKIGFAQVSLESSWETILTNLLSGPAVLIIDGFASAIIIDARTYPARSVEEPDVERVTKGARDGFVETMLFNANLIRRRIRSSKLCFEIHSVGSQSRTDVAVAYLADSVNTSLLNKISQTLDALDITTLTMGAKSLEELLVPKHWWNPLPSIRMTERPDVACSYLSEGHILILVDNSPLVLILPCTVFQFTQTPEDYYKTPAVGTYFRFARFCCIPISLLLIPVFLLLSAYFPDFARQWELVSDPDMTPQRLFFYVLTVEFLLDLFKYSSALSGGKFSGSLSIVGGLIIGEVAIDLNWASPEVLFYGAVTLLASLAITDIDFSDGIRLYRLLLIVLTGLWGTFGFLTGLCFILFSVATTPTFGKYSYFWPLFPFCPKAFMRLLFRSPTSKAQPAKVWDRGNAR